MPPIGRRSALRKKFERPIGGRFGHPDRLGNEIEPVNVRDSGTVQRRAELVGERFEAPNLAKMLGEPRFEEPIELAPYVAEIRRKAAELFALADEVNEAHRKADRARITRKRAREAYGACTCAALLCPWTCPICTATPTIRAQV